MPKRLYLNRKIKLDTKVAVNGTYTIILFGIANVTYAAHAFEQTKTETSHICD